MNKIKKHRLEWINLTDKPLSVVDWIVFCVIAGFCFVTFQQGDIFHTGGSSFAYLNGHILDFYDYNASYVGGNAYLPSTYILFAIWNIPIYLLKLVTLPTCSVPWFVTMWYKALPSLIYLMSGFIMYKIGTVMNLGFKKSKLMAYIFLTSPLAFFSQFIFGQYDVFTTFFVLLGVYFYLKNDMLKFAIFFGVAVTFKYFALLIFVPLLLLKEKNILKIVRNIAIAAIPFIIEVLLYFKSSAFVDGVFGFGAKNYIFDAGFNIYCIGLSIVVVLWIATSVWAFFTDANSHEDLVKWALYFCNIVVFLIFGLSMWHPQWLLFAVPFMVMSTVINKKIDIFLLIDIVLMLFFTVFTVNIWPNNVDQNLLYNGIFKNLLDCRLGLEVSMRKLLCLDDMKLVYSCISGLFLVNALFKHPKFTTEKFNESIDKHWNIVRARFICGVAIFVVPALICMISSFYSPYTILNTFQGEIGGTVDPIVQGRSIEQYFVANKENITKLQMVTDTYQRKNNSSINVSIKDENDNILFSRKYVTTNFKDNDATNFNIDNIKTQVGKVYKILIVTDNTDTGNAITLYHTKENTSSVDTYAVMDGKKMNYNLALTVLGK